MSSLVVKVMRHMARKREGNSLNFTSQLFCGCESQTFYFGYEVVAVFVQRNLTLRANFLQPFPLFRKSFFCTESRITRPMED